MTDLRELDKCPALRETGLGRQVPVIKEEVKRIPLYFKDRETGPLMDMGNPGRVTQGKGKRALTPHLDWGRKEVPPLDKDREVGNY
jgi:hypothetical protein